MINSVTDVYGEWIVPTVISKGGNGYSSIWVGIDGFSSGSVEQLGTEQDWTNSGASYYAWFEMYPGPSQWIKGFPVNPGDHIAGEVAYTGTNRFSLTLVNYTKNMYTSTTIITTTASPLPSRSSAEWIVEAPSLNGVLPLADYQTATFTNCSATINQVKGAINNPSWINTPLTMVTSNGTPKSVPSNLLLDGTSFTTTWGHK